MTPEQLRRSSISDTSQVQFFVFIPADVNKGHILDANMEPHVKKKNWGLEAESSPLHSKTGGRRNLMAYGHDVVSGNYSQICHRAEGEWWPSLRRRHSRGWDIAYLSVINCLIGDRTAHEIRAFIHSWFRDFVCMAVTSSGCICTLFTDEQRQDACETPDQFWVSLGRTAAKLSQTQECKHTSWVSDDITPQQHAFGVSLLMFLNDIVRMLSRLRAHTGRRDEVSAGSHLALIFYSGYLAHFSQPNIRI